MLLLSYIVYFLGCVLPQFTAIAEIITALASWQLLWKLSQHMPVDS